MYRTTHTHRFDDADWRIFKQPCSPAVNPSRQVRREIQQEST